MKKYNLLYILMAGMMLFTSCEDFLNTDSPSEQSKENLFENEGMTRSAIMGVYSELAGTYVYGQKMSVNWQGVSDIEQASGYQEDPATDKTSDSGAANYWCDWYNKTLQWGYIFKMAELASTAVDGIRASEAFNNGTTAMKRYMGEALVLRSLSYFELVRRWGDIPFKEGMSSSDLSNVYMGKINRDSIYACIVKDMQEAIEYLPWVGEVADYNSERITKGFAKGMLARIALFAGGWSVRDGKEFPANTSVERYSNTEQNPGMEEVGEYFIGRPINWRDYYEIAEQQCAEIIGDPENPHRLDPDYGDIWKSVCGLKANTYNENLFEVANGVGYSGDIGTLMGRAMDGNLGYGQRGFGGTYVSTNAYYFYSFDQNDMRRDYACYWPVYKKDGTIKEVMQNDIMSVRLGKWSFFWTAESYRSIALTATARTPTGINWIVMRYPDILLMFAEARYMLGKGENSVSDVAGISAARALEMVRERAFGSGAEAVMDYKKVDFFDAIVNERAWEFGGEGIRKLDLIRWGLLDSKIEEMKVAMLYMLDGSHPVEIFDKTYQPEEFPNKLYFKYDENGEFIDFSSINFYTKRAANPDEKVYTEIKWFPETYWNVKETDINKDHSLIKNATKILVCASGLRKSYDYSQLLSTLKYGSLIQDRLNGYKIGNGVCNYRHLFSIYYDDIYKSKGYLSNSYGYDNSAQ